MNKLKIGIIGIGRMGLTHYSILNSHPDIQIIAIADTSSIVLNLMKKYLPVKSYKDYRKLIEESIPDAILVCTPPDFNYEIIRMAADKNIHVFVEKPFTTSENHAFELANLFEAKSLINQVGYVNRFNDIFLNIRELIKRELIGSVILFKSEMFSGTIIKSNAASGWRASRKSGGGAVFEVASHAIDLVNFLIGKPDKVIGSSLNHIYSKYVEDAMSTTFLYKDGCTGTVFVNWSDESYRKPTNKVEVFGVKGKIIADQYSFKVYLKYANPEFGFHEGFNTVYITDVFNNVPFYVRGNEFTRQLYHFVDCIQNPGQKNLCSFRDGANTLKIIDDIFNDYELNGKISL